MQAVRRSSTTIVIRIGTLTTKRYAIGRADRALTPLEALAARDRALHHVL
jgi:hypothetical protein